jgi:hypothetical protein
VKLSDTELMILSAASQREDHAAVLPPNLKGNAARKVVDKLVDEGLLQEFRAKDDMPVWRRGDDHRPYSLRITKVGLKTLSLDAPEEPAAQVDATNAASPELVVQAARSKSPTRRQGRSGKSAAKKKPSTAAKTKATKKSAGKGAAESKQNNVIALLRRPEGATLDALVKATGWQKHSVRGFLAGTVRKKLKLSLASEKVDGTRTYRIGKAKAAKATKAVSSRPV